MYTNMDLLGLVTMAYEVHAYQVVGPDWLNSTRFDIAAKLSPGTTLAQFRVMLQNLLADRFKLAVHRDQKQFRGFDLTVEGAERSWPSPPKTPCPRLATAVRSRRCPRLRRRAGTPAKSLYGLPDRLWSTSPRSSPACSASRSTT
jgi:uncharacterized protein (TIGR03435 family)